MSERPIYEETCNLCSGSGKTTTSSFAMPRREIVRSCPNCNGSGFVTNVGALRASVARLESALSEARRETARLRALDEERLREIDRSDIAKAVLVIAEGMKGVPLDEEIADLVTDAIWDAFVAGKEAAQRALAAPAAATPPDVAPEPDMFVDAATMEAIRAVATFPASCHCPVSTATGTVVPSQSCPVHGWKVSPRHG